MRLLAVLLFLGPIVFAQPKPDDKPLPIADLFKWQRDWEDKYKDAQKTGNPIAVKDVAAKRAAELDQKYQGVVYEGIVTVKAIREGTSSRSASLEIATTPDRDVAVVRIKNSDDPALTKLVRGQPVLLRATVAARIKGTTTNPTPPTMQLILTKGEVFPDAPKDK